jgi:hypothetical protein
VNNELILKQQYKQYCSVKTPRAPPARFS